MYPILVNALAATAGNLIDRWAQARLPKAGAPAVPFQNVLDAAAPPSPIERLRNALLSSPELRTAVDSSDPTRPVSLQLSPDGTVTAQAPGQLARPITLSPETATLARSLATILPANASL